jgi:hypothetical protein
MMCGVIFQCSPFEFYSLARTLNKVSEQLGSFSEMALKDLKSELLLSIVREVGVKWSCVSLVLLSVCVCVGPSFAERAARHAG